MKKLLLVSLIFLLVAPILASAPQISTVHISNTGRVSSNTLHSTPELPEKVRNAEPMNLSEEVSPMSALDEVRERESNHPIYVLLFGDEEERGNYRYIPGSRIPLAWYDYAALQIERGDEALVANFGIDIRIVGYLLWSSDNSLTTMDDLWNQLEDDTGSYLCQRYYGQFCSNYVDCVIGITGQATVDGTAGLAPGNEEIDSGEIFVLLRWQCYWADDNLLGHEISHCFYTDDHYFTCCAMASHTHYWSFLYEDALYPIFYDIPCAYTTYTWCSSYFDEINSHRDMYQFNDPPIPIDWWDIYPTECRAMYFWLDELTGNTWTEYKGAINPAIRIR